MVAIWRTRSRNRLFHWQSGFSMYYHRHSNCLTDIQDWLALPMAFWFYRCRHRQSDWLHTHPAESALADFRRIVGLVHAYIIWLTTMHHNYRYSMGKATLQDGGAFACTFRQRRDVWILIL